MGRAPCCDKTIVKRGPWSPEEDTKLKSYIEDNGTGGNWIALPQKIGLKRCGKSCRLRWLNYLRPNIKHGSFSEEEDNIILSLYVTIGSRWSIIAAQLPGRTDNDIKNYWNTKLKKKLEEKQRKEQQAQACRVLRQKQEIKRENNDEDLMMLPIGVVSPTPYWPQQQQHCSWPIQVANASKLNNKTSSSSINNHFPNNIVTSTTMNSQQYYSSCDTSLLTQNQLHPSTMNDTCHTPNVFHGLGNFPGDLAGVDPQQIDGSILRVFYGLEAMDFANCSTNTTSTETTSWGDINSLVSDYEACQQQQRIIMPQGVSFEDSNFAMQMQ